MTYYNCVDFIYNELDTRIGASLHADSLVVIWGLDSLSKVVIHYIQEKFQAELLIFDFETNVDTYAGIRINSKCDLGEVERDNVFFIITNKKYLDLFFKRRLKDKRDYADLTYIRMDNMPNPIALEGRHEKASLKECHNEMLTMMDDIDCVCKNNGLRYFLDSGSLLGAIRHKGFIPWDDDIDIVMPVPDYYIFCEKYSHEGMYQLDYYRNAKCEDIQISVLAKVKSDAIITEFRHFPLRTISGISIDIIPLCGFPEGDEQEAFMKEFIMLGDEWKEKVIIPYGTERYSKNSHLELCRKIDSLISRYDYEKSRYVGPAYCGPYVNGGYSNRAIPHTSYAYTVNAEFEGRKFYIPNDYDTPLKRWYGDYMTPPPVEKRDCHNIEGIYRKEYLH